MKKGLFIFISFLAFTSLGQIFPDSLKTTFTANLSDKDTIKIYTSRRNCFGGSFEKFYLTKHKGKYILTAFMPIKLYELAQKGIKLQNISPDTLVYDKLKSYKLADTNVVAFAKIEFLGTKCGMKPRNAGGAIRTYKIIYMSAEKNFSNMCNPIKDIEDIAIPEKYWDDIDKQDEKNSANFNPTKCPEPTIKNSDKIKDKPVD